MKQAQQLTYAEIQALSPAEVQGCESHPGPDEFYAQNCGGDLPGRLETLAAFFNSLCLVEDGKGNPLLSENCYDAASVNSLEIANQCISQAKAKQGDHWRGGDDTLDVINALSVAAPGAAKLKEIRKRQNGVLAKSGDENAALLTPEHAIEFLVAWIKTARGKERRDFRRHAEDQRCVGGKPPCG